MNANEISENLRSGIYRSLPPIKNGRRLKSTAWDIWQWIVDEDGETIVGKIDCIHCFAIQDYKSTSGTTNLLDYKSKCLLAHLSYSEIQTIKSSVNEKVVQFVAQGIRPFRSSSCPGFLALADKVITIGDRYGPLKAKDILPHRTTVSKLVSEDAETKRTQLKSKIVHLQSQLNKIGDDNPVKALLEDCRRLVVYTKRSGIQYRLPNGLRNEVLSRWNATLFMLESIKLAQETDEILEIREQSDLLTDIDNDLLEKVVDLLKPFLEATLHFEAKKNPTIHFVALHRIDLEEHLTGTPHDSSAIIEMKDHGLNYLQEKWIIDDIQKKAVFFILN